MPYVPYARQDRVCNKGEAHGAKVFCELINTLNFDKVTILDPHSDVVGAVLNNVKIITQVDLYNNLYSRYFDVFDGKILVAPDVGASKKVEALAKVVGHDFFIQGTKKRDLVTGKLSGFGYDLGGRDIAIEDLLIIDDICDGGGTFLGLAKELRMEQPKSISLFVSHGVFSQGFDKLLDNGITRIYTTDSLDNLSENDKRNSRITILPWR
jgi:ribose-phosphate pyrophosphokinase